MTRLAVAIFHGIGTFEAGFADPLIREIERRLAARFAGVAAAPQIVCQPIQWGDVLEPRQTELLRRIFTDSSLGWRSLRGALIAGLGDAITFHPTPDNRKDYDAVRARIAEQLGRLADAAGPDAPLCVIAHSFGSIVASNYLLGCRQGESPFGGKDSPLVRGQTLATLITLGSPLALWSLRSSDYGKPLRVPAEELRRQNPQLEGAWLNLYDPNDVLAYPMRQLNAAHAEAVLDMPVNISGILAGWSPFSHFGYWTNETVLLTIVASLSVLWRQTEQSRGGHFEQSGQLAPVNERTIPA